MAPTLSATTGWLLYAALVAAAGGVTAYWLLIPGLKLPASPVKAWLEEAAWRLGLLGGSFLPVALTLVFIRQMIEFRDPFVPWTEDVDLLLTGTSWGRTWLLGVTGSFLAAAAFALAVRGRRLAWWISGFSVLGLGCFPAFTGHANGTEGLKPLTLMADTVHVWAVGVWVGGLAFVLYANRGWLAREGKDAQSLLPLLVPGFSRVAVASVGALVVTGSISGWVHLSGFGDLIVTPYGQLLSLKLILAVGVFTLGFLNWRQLTPRLAEASGQRALTRAATAELLIVQGVLIVTSILVVTPPPAH